MSRKQDINYFPCGARTDVGRVREHNEDSLLVMVPLFAVADGMGGHEAGEVASEIATKTLATSAPKKADAKALGRAVCAANRAVIRAATYGEGRPGMGTTLTAAIVDGPKLVIAQVGDSRAYLLHEGSLQQITRDHSLVADLVRRGKITEQEAQVHPSRSVITRALGSDTTMEPDLYELGLNKGDRLLLCTDGLYGMLSKDRIKEILCTYDHPQETTDALISEACAAGGYDNLTAIVVDVIDITNKEEARHKKNKRFLGIALWIFAALLAIGLACGGFFLYARNSFYVAENDGYVALYRGIPGSWGSISLSWLEETTDIPVDVLPATTENRLKDGIVAGNETEATALIEDYRSYKEDAEATQAEAEVSAEGEESATGDETSRSEDASADEANDADSENDTQGSTE